MAVKSGKKWIPAVLMAVVFPALAVHVSCVAVIGPGSWGSGMEEKAPVWLAIEPGSPVAAYIGEFRSREPIAQPTFPELEGVQGKAFWSDYVRSENLGVLATHEGQAWVEKQHFYLWRRERDDVGDRRAKPGESGQEAPRPDEGEQAARPEGQAEAQPDNEAGAQLESQAKGQGIRELDLPSEMILERPTLLARNGQMFLVVGRWRPWAIPPLEKLSRYLKSYADPTLRPEFLLYVHPLSTGALEYWGSGHTLKPSPDRRFAILLRSGAIGAGYYSMHLWDFEQDRLTTIVSLREADAGSGRSFEYDWSYDSRAVHITGMTGGFKRRGGTPRSLDLIYLVGVDGLYDLETGNE
jgi:hypothetical protein